MSASAPLGEGRDLRLLVPALIGWFTSALAIWLRPSLVVVLGVIAVTGGLWLVTRTHPTGKLAVVMPSAVITAVMLVSVLLGVGGARTGSARARGRFRRHGNYSADQNLHSFHGHGSGGTGGDGW